MTITNGRVARVDAYSRKTAAAAMAWRATAAAGRAYLPDTTTKKHTLGCLPVPSITSTCW